MSIAILKQAALENLFAVGMVTVTAYCLYISLRHGIGFGKWPGQGFTKEEKPILYWLCVVGYALCFTCSIFILVIVVKSDVVAANWPASPKNPN